MGRASRQLDCKLAGLCEPKRSVHPRAARSCQKAIATRARASRTRAVSTKPHSLDAHRNASSETSSPIAECRPVLPLSGSLLTNLDLSRAVLVSSFEGVILTICRTWESRDRGKAAFQQSQHKHLIHGLLSPSADQWQCTLPLLTRSGCLAMQLWTIEAIHCLPNLAPSMRRLWDVDLWDLGHAKTAEQPAVSVRKKGTCGMMDIIPSPPHPQAAPPGSMTRFARTICRALRTLPHRKISSPDDAFTTS